MFKKLTLAVAAGAGYVLGAKAGKERYQQIEGKVREIAGMPAVQDATATVKENAAPLLDSAKETVGDKVTAVTDKAKSKNSDTSIDVTGTGARTSTRSTATRSTAPAGVAPSGTAPIIRP
jgi:hypothetical protein